MSGTEGVPPAPWGASSEGNAGTAGEPKKRKTGRNVAIVGGVALLLVVVGAAASPLGAGSSVELAANSVDMSKPLNAESAKDLAFTITGGKMSDVTLKLDGNLVQPAQEGDKFIFRPSGLADGKHTFSASKDGLLPGRTSTAAKNFEIDTVAPVLSVDKPEGQQSADAPYTLTGKVEGASALKVDDKDVAIGKDGTFSVDYAKTPVTMKVWASDNAGNVTEQTASTNLRYAGMRAVHMTALAWAYKPLKDPVIQLLKDKKIDTIELDIKDEEGLVGYDSAVPLAKDSGATEAAAYNLDEAVKEIHALGGRVVGRIVAFRDPKLAKYAIKQGKTAMVIQDKSGRAYNAGSYGSASFTNFGNADVRQYNIDLAVEAAKAGFDDIMYDYIRRPESNAASGGLDGQVFPGLPESTDKGVTAQELGIANFVDQAGEAIHAAGAGVGAAVFGISSFTPASVAQNIPMMAKSLDFINPMVYPSHWGPGEYSVKSPNNQPYDIVHRSLMDFNRQVLGTNAVIIPWLQDFSLGVRYGEAELRQQIKATKDVGINSFVLWNATAKYTASALEVGEYAEDAEGELVYSINKPGNNSEGSKDSAKAKAFIDAYYESKKNGTTFVDPTEPAAAGSSTAATSTTGSATPAPSATPSAAATEPTAAP